MYSLIDMKNYASHQS